MKTRLVLGVALVAASILSRISSVEQAMSWTSRLAGGLARSGKWTFDKVQAETLLMWWSGLVPRANCMDRAMALRWFGARHGAVGQVVIGFKRAPLGADEPWMGHAWVLWDDGSTSFMETTQPHKIVLMERGHES